MVVAAYTEGGIPLFGWAWNLLWHTPQCDCGNKGVSRLIPALCQQPESCCPICGSWCDGLGCGSCSLFSSMPRVVPAALGLNRQSLLVQSFLQSSCLEAS